VVSARCLQTDNERHRFCRTGARVYSLVQDVLVIDEFGQWSLPGHVQDPPSTRGDGLTCNGVPTRALRRRGAGRPIPAGLGRKNPPSVLSYWGDVNVRRDLTSRPLIVNPAGDDSLGSRRGLVMHHATGLPARGAAAPGGAIPTAHAGGPAAYQDGAEPPLVTPYSIQSEG
jgi:hypothetical protein